MMPTIFLAAGFLTTLPLLYKVVLAVWIAVLGSCFGSFMNVVIYRVPAGLNVAHPGSRCPRCLHAIRAFDNIPVFSWLILRGRCRDCGATISSRYPLIEALVAAVTLGLAGVEIFSVAPNLPWESHYLAHTASLDWLLPAAFASHALLLYTLICAALIEHDRHAPPPKLFYLVIAVGLLGPVLWPALSVARVSCNTKTIHNVLFDGPTGGLVGAGLGLLLVPIARRLNPIHSDRRALAGVFAAIGVALGPLAATVIAGCTGVWCVVALIASRSPGQRRVPVIAVATVLAALAVIGWQTITRRYLSTWALDWSTITLVAGLLSLVSLFASLTNRDANACAE